jgi:hypothetical protein
MKVEHTRPDLHFDLEITCLSHARATPIREYNFEVTDEAFVKAKWFNTCFSWLLSKVPIEDQHLVPNK